MKPNSIVLCVVDMQPFFSSTADHCLEEVKKEVRKAKRRNAPIVFLEYSGCGRTYEELVHMVAQYPNVFFITKDNDGGGDELHRALSVNKVPTKTIRFCGVNRSACVLHTVTQTVDHGYDVEVALKATWCHYPNSGRTELRGFSRFT